jgi:sulfite reductase (NADPH) hemoprotein beta-component
LRKDIEAEFERIRNGVLHLPKADIEAIDSYFAPPQYRELPDDCAELTKARAADAGFDRWIRNNTAEHRVSGHAIVTISLKPAGGPPGDATDRQMEIMADLAERYSHDELRISHEQNVILPHVEKGDLKAIHEILAAEGLAPANAGLITDIIACPGLDYCALANARSIPVAQEISEHFTRSGKEQEIGDLKIKISGCINACGHHHVGNIGILGVDRKGEEFYQITLGGSADEHTSIGSIVGPGFASTEIVGAIDKIVDTYLGLRSDAGEDFLATYRRVGQQPFKEALYG